MIKTPIFFLFLLFCLTLPFGAKAAEFRLESDGTSFGVGDEFLVTVTIDTQGEMINAVQGEIAFPEDFLELKGIREKGSIVNLWIIQPSASLTQGGPSFSGLTPGGYAGKGVLFSLIFEAKAQGEGVVAIDQGQALLNDGEGTETELTIFNFQFSIFNQDANSQSSKLEIADDTDPPEPFELRIGQAPHVFDGERFLVFVAQDKNSGIDYYEISIVRVGTATVWEKATSPFLLEQYDDITKIQVRAVDRSGNVRSAALSVKNPSFVFLSLRNIVILMGIGGVLVYLYWRKKRTL